MTCNDCQEHEHISFWTKMEEAPTSWEVQFMEKLSAWSFQCFAYEAFSQDLAYNCD